MFVERRDILGGLFCRRDIHCQRNYTVVDSHAQLWSAKNALAGRKDR